MRGLAIVGVVLIILGVAGFVYKGVSYTKTEKVVDLGPLQVESKEEKTVPIPEILSGVAVAGGIALFVVGMKKK